MITMQHCGVGKTTLCSPTKQAVTDHTHVVAVDGSRARPGEVHQAEYDDTRDKGGLPDHHSSQVDIRRFLMPPPLNSGLEEINGCQDSLLPLPRSLQT